jgi:hypothetical protein
VGVQAALDRALREALEFHARLGHKVPEWENGRVVWVDPAELLKNGHGNGHAKSRGARKRALAAKPRRAARRRRI